MRVIVIGATDTIDRFMRDATKNRLIAFCTITGSKREVGQSR